MTLSWEELKFYVHIMFSILLCVEINISCEKNHEFFKKLINDLQIDLLFVVLNMS